MAILEDIGLEVVLVYRGLNLGRMRVERKNREGRQGGSRDSFFFFFVKDWRILQCGNGASMAGGLNQVRLDEKPLAQVRTERAPALREGR